MFYILWRGEEFVDGLRRVVENYRHSSFVDAVYGQRVDFFTFHGDFSITVVINPFLNVICT